MTIFIYDSFLVDLRENGDSAFAQRVIRRVITASGVFRPDADDHRYHGIQDAWIRYVSGGKSAFRVIYIRQNENVYLYRAGGHSIEDRLAPPRPGAGTIEISETIPSPHGAPAAPVEHLANRFLQNGRKRLLRTFLLGRRLMPHNEVLLISPFISLPLLARVNRFGQALDDLIDDGAKVTLITRWPAALELDAYRELEIRGIDLLFHRRLHAKLYIFVVRSDNKYKSEFHDAAAIGSANLTEKGFGFDETNFNEELCYELPLAAHESAMEFAAQLASEAADLTRVRRDLAARR